MLLDVNLLLSSNQAITVTAPSSGVYDTAGLGVGVPVQNRFGLPTQGGNASFGNDLGGGGPNNASAPQLGVIVGTAFTAGGAATLRIQLEAAADTNNNSGTPGTWDIIDQTDDIPVADLVAGAIPASFTVPKRYLGQNFPRFYRLNYLVSTGPMTAGTIVFAGFLTGIDDNPLYPANF
jgi:hypothetical protein